MFGLKNSIRFRYDPAVRLTVDPLPLDAVGMNPISVTDPVRDCDDQDGPGPGLVIGRCKCFLK